MKALAFPVAPRSVNRSSKNFSLQGGYVLPCFFLCTPSLKRGKFCGERMLFFRLAQACATRVPRNILRDHWTPFRMCFLRTKEGSQRDNKPWADSAKRLPRRGENSWGEFEARVVRRLRSKRRWGGAESTRHSVTQSNRIRKCVCLCTMTICWWRAHCKTFLRILKSAGTRKKSTQ